MQEFSHSKNGSKKSMPDSYELTEKIHSNWKSLYVKHTQTLHLHVTSSTERAKALQQTQRQQPHLDGLARIQVLALVGALQDVGQHDSLHVCSGQLQQVIQALVPGLESPQLACVLAQPHGHCVQQPGCAIPAFAQAGELILSRPCLCPTVLSCWWLEGNHSSQGHKLIPKGLDKEGRVSEVRGLGVM